MIRLVVSHADAATLYVPAPCRGTVSGVKVAFQADTVEPNDTVVVSQGATPVVTVTAVATGGLVVEKGVLHATNKSLVFDPDSKVAAEQVIVITDTGAPGAKVIIIEFDDYAYIERTPLEA